MSKPKEKTEAGITADSLDSAIKKCKIDTKVWEVDSFSTKELASGDFLWTIYFKRRALSKLTIDQLRGDLVKLSPKIPKIEYSGKDNPLLLEVSIFDHHIGKLAYAPEVGENYDIKIACQVYREAVDYTIKQAEKFKISKILIPCGQDYLHVDGTNNMTTLGTPQDCDSRFTKMFVKGRELLVETIDKLKQIAPVDVVCCWGNHDQDSMFHLADALHCWYHNDPNVYIDNSPTQRKYYSWGKNLLGYTHGNNEKIENLGLIMSREKQREWGRAKFFYWKLGHFHTRKMIMNEAGGVVIEVLPSLAPSDSWHSSKGYVGNIKGSVSSIYDKEKGQVHKIFFNS